MSPATNTVVVYVPSGGFAATEGIASKSAIVGRPEPGGDFVTIYFEGAVHQQANMKTLADRASHAAGRLEHRAPAVAMLTVPREALVAVGTFDPREGRILLTGPHSEREVARWLQTSELDPAELALDGGRGS